MLTPEQIKVLQHAVETNGILYQLDIATEEAAEFVAVMAKWRNKRTGIERVASEAADMIIVCNYVLWYFQENHPGMLDQVIAEKVERLADSMKGSEHGEL